MCKIKKYPKAIIIYHLINHTEAHNQLSQSSILYKEHFVIDLFTSTEWMRCSVGQSGMEKPVLEK